MGRGKGGNGRNLRLFSSLSHHWLFLLSLGRCPWAEGLPVHREPPAGSPESASGGPAAPAPRGPGPLCPHFADCFHLKIDPSHPHHGSLLPTCHWQCRHRRAHRGNAVRNNRRAAGSCGTHGLLSNHARLLAPWMLPMPLRAAKRIWEQGFSERSALDSAGNCAFW